DLAKMGLAGDQVCLLSRLAQGGEQDCDEQGDNPNDDEELDERESAGAPETSSHIYLRLIAGRQTRDAICPRMCLSGSGFRHFRTTKSIRLKNGPTYVILRKRLHVLRQLGIGHWSFVIG